MYGEVLMTHRIRFPLLSEAARRRLLDDVDRLRPRARAGEGIAMNNLAVVYRALGRLRLAFKWWQRCADSGDGDAFLEIGYCLQYGIGVRRDAVGAMSAYRRAARSRRITEYGREEALYHCAVAELDKGGPRGAAHAAALLREAAADGDYPQARDLLEQLQSRSPLTICRCRRGLRPSLGGRAQCAVHTAHSR